MFCHNCGVKLVEGADFCHKCGTKVLADTGSAIQKLHTKDLKVIDLFITYKADGSCKSPAMNGQEPDVLVDDRKIGRLIYGKTTSYKITPGRHCIAAGVLYVWIDAPEGSGPVWVTIWSTPQKDGGLEYQLICEPRHLVIPEPSDSPKGPVAQTPSQERRPQPPPSQTVTQAPSQERRQSNVPQQSGDSFKPIKIFFRIVATLFNIAFVCLAVVVVLKWDYVDEFLLNLVEPGWSVRGAYLSQYSEEVTIEEAFNNYFDNGTWSTYKEKDYSYVVFTGSCKYFGEMADVKITFKITGENFIVDSLDVNGRTQNELFLYGLLLDVYEDY